MVSFFLCFIVLFVFYCVLGTLCAAMCSHLLQLVAGLYNNQEAAVRWNGQLTAGFPIGQGTRQGCNVSPTEFNLP